jgi:drug/metabolite transporter (DMT)-like permease
MVCIFWGFSFISTKICLQWFTPFSLAFFRFLIASIVLYFTLKLTKQDLKIDKKDIGRFVLCGFFGVFIYFSTENLAIDMLSASLTSIFLALLPAFTIVADYLVLKAPFTKRKVLSVSTSVLGAILVGGFELNGSKNMIFGIILIIASAISWVIFGYLSLPLQSKYSPLKATFYQNLFGMFFFMLVMPFNVPSFEGFNTSGLLHMLFLGVICSALCYLLYNIAIKNISVMVSSIFINLMPIVTIAASILILNERINPMQGLGAALIIGSVFVVTNKSKERVVE